MVEVLPQILPVEDAEIAAFARKAFEKQGIKILTGAKVTKLDKKGDSVTATIDDGKGGTQTLTVERVISAVGVVGNIENLGLEKVGVKTDRGAIVVDDLSRTNVPGIYAIGDVAGPADARAQGRARGRHLRRGDQGPQAASDGQAASSPAAPIARRRSPRSGSPSRPRRRRSSTSASAASRSPATARRSRSARTRAWSR